MLMKAQWVPFASSRVGHSNRSRIVVLVALTLTAALALSADTADARKGGRHRGHGFSRHFIVPVSPPSDGYARGGFESRPFGHRSIEDNGFDRPRIDRRDAKRGDLLAIVPSDWREQSPDPNWEGRRFVSPQGNAWVEFYARPAEAQSRDHHLKAVASVHGEEVTYLRRDRDWLVVSGFKGEAGERTFYRKVVLACGEREWRHIAFEYPAEAKRAFDRLVTSLSRALDGAVDNYCEDASVGRR
jgi:hypothetical protein